VFSGGAVDSTTPAESDRDAEAPDLLPEADVSNSDSCEYEDAAAIASSSDDEFQEEIPSTSHSQPSTSQQPTANSKWMSGLSRSEKKISKLGSPVPSRREVIEEEAEELQDVETAASRSDVGWCIANINLLKIVLGNLNCSVCEDSGCVQFTKELKKKHGFSLSLQLLCASCHNVL